MTRFLSLQHCKVACDVNGSGPAILMIHGAEAERGSFGKVAQLLCNATTVVTYDQRGCGETESDGVEHTILDLADDAEELLRMLGLSSAYIFGTSLGGLVAQAIAWRHPEVVCGLILCNSWPLRETLPNANPAGVQKLQALRASLPATAAELAAMFYTDQYVAANPEAAKRFEKVKATSARARLANESHDFELSRIAARTLLLSGEDDQIVPTSVMRRIKASIPLAELVVMPETGHSAAVQAPGPLCTEILAFVSSVEAAQHGASFNEQEP